ncbi:DUF362 domain-containing protein [Tepidimicrobium xylanilyticum]|uniref:DUF362 domain-containing protein n=1 Tax=Tepidimicrobium xylanilyticum TaxID=1123352 RepID=UPI0026563A5D|nr:DUF362 domain-containing protein [Tepidimicrobium xylanilyticum]GMG97801.1 hypothetical protein EN5CB1_26270 [Tepidimicrobium xylanilyticum]
MEPSTLYVIYGNEPKLMVKKILSKIDLEKEIPNKDALIGIKPNLVLAKPSTSGATTCPNLVEGVVEYLKSKGYNNLAILEGAWVGDKTQLAFKVCGYEELSKKYNIPLIDLQKDSFTDYELNGMTFSICDSIMEVDYLINMPVLKGHCQTNITCALKNMKGCIPNKEKRRFHTMGLHKPIAYLNKILKQDLIVVDGILGDLNFEEGGNPVQMNRVIVGKDPVLIDSYVAQLLGYDLEDIPYIKMAEEIGVGNTKLLDENIVELNKDSAPMTIPKTRLVKELTANVEENMACSACYGSLVHALDRLKEMGYLNNMDGKIYIGQGYKDIEGNGIGIGNCTKGLKNNLPGCPPKAKDIIDFLIKSF